MFTVPQCSFVEATVCVFEVELETVYMK